MTGKNSEPDTESSSFTNPRIIYPLAGMATTILGFVAGFSHGWYEGATASPESKDATLDLLGTNLAVVGWVTDITLQESWVYIFMAVIAIYAVILLSGELDRRGFRE